MMDGFKECTPFCESFRCIQDRGTLKFRKKSGKKVAWCTSFDDVCDGAWCQYSKCTIRKMTDNGRCKREKIPKRVVTVPEHDLIEDPSAIPDKYAKKLRGKLEF